MTETPVVAGFYPDPSVCRVGDRYYLANSSFELRPGVPLHTSTDLVTWEPLGHALTRPTQLQEDGGRASGGIYAPTIRHHGGMFFLVTTDLLQLHTGKGVFISTAEDPAGPWSEPVHVQGAIGIDPDIVWDDDDVCHLTWASFAPLHGIASAPIDPVDGRLLGEPQLLWQGTGGAHAEGPHLYRHDGWWYLLLAEGGTERGHMATIARSHSLEGPWDGAPSNPILTHRSSPQPVQNTGHADLIECADGTWAIVFLGVRPRGTSPKFHVNGRETFVAKVDWIDGWPVIDESRIDVTPTDHSFEDSFTAPTLDPRWVSVGAYPTSFTRPAPNGGVTIDAASSAPGLRILAVRARDDQWEAEAEAHIDASSRTRFRVRLDDAHWYGIEYDGSTVSAVLTVGPVQQVVSTSRHTGPITMRISSRAPEPVWPVGADEPDLITLSFVNADGEEHSFGSFDGRYLSTEVAGGFTGRIVGVEALEGDTLLTRFRYTTLAAE